MEKLTESKFRLLNLQTELSNRKEELDVAEGLDVPIILPTNNTRIGLDITQTEGKKPEEDDSTNDSNDAITRAEVKRRAQLLQIEIFNVFLST